MLDRGDGAKTFSLFFFFFFFLLLIFLRMSGGQSAGTKLKSVDFEIFGHVQGPCVNLPLSVSLLWSVCRGCKLI